MSEATPVAADAPSFERTLVTSALPYANGDIHLGHLVEYIATDVFVRFLRMAGEEAIYLCASDAHGTPIELKALEQGIAPEELVERYRRRHLDDFRGFGIAFDDFYTTHSPETERHARDIFEAARAQGLIETRTIEGFFSEKDGRFLPDRFIRGTCPRCKSPDQYGDSCEVCGATYQPTDLEDPRSALSGDRPVRRESVHYFYRLASSTELIRAWVDAPGRMPAATRQFVHGWLERGLEDWDISRDAPYFGFLIPGETDKYFYVWLDAPVGYIGTTAHWCAQHGGDVGDWWRSPTTRIVHVIGKDIVYFHCLFWPALLARAGYTMPDRIQVHGFLTVNGQKMSKSRGTFIAARTYLEHLDPEALRYYYASKQRSEPEDLDLHVGTWTDPADPATLDTTTAELVLRVNSELVNKVANLTQRVLPFVRKHFDGRLGRLPEAGAAARARVAEVVVEAEAAYRRFDFASVTRLATELAEDANGYFQAAAPWAVVKTDPEEARAICTLAANYAKVVAGLLKPVVPSWVERVELALGVAPLAWSDLALDLEDHALGDADTRIEPVDPVALERLIHASRGSLDAAKRSTEGAAGGTAAPRAGGAASEPAAPRAGGAAGSRTLPTAGSGSAVSAPGDGASDESGPPEIGIDAFGRVDLRVARVLTAEAVEGADKLLRLTADLGPLGTRTIFAGLRKHYAPEVLVGRSVIVVANLAPRKMRFGTSEGMVLAATSGGDVLVLDVDGDPAPGSRVS